MHLIYTSHATEPFTETDLKKLLLGSRLRNAQAGLSGMLVHHHGVFLQMLEGPPETVMRVFERIRHDDRHAGVRVLHRDDTAHHRHFPDWSMGFSDTTGSARLLKGFKQVGSQIGFDRLGASEALALLKQCAGLDPHRKASA